MTTPALPQPRAVERDIPIDVIPEYDADGVPGRVIAGASVEQGLPDTHNAFVDAYRGALKFDSSRRCRNSASPAWPTPRAATGCALAPGTSRLPSTASS